MAQQKVTIPIPTNLTFEQREVLAQEIVDYIAERSTSGVGVVKVDTGVWKNKKFPKYSPEYVDEKGQSEVDLFLSGEMLDELRALTHRVGAITIGYEGNDQLQGKVEGNRKGTYGKKKPIPGKQRDFLGINKTDLKELIKQVMSDDQD